MASSRNNRQLGRKPPHRTVKSRALIVCEGSKTEPHYLNEIIHHLRLTNVDFRICGQECGTDPMSVYKFALSQYNSDRNYDVVFCVIDKNGHSNYNEALMAMKSKKLPHGRKIRAIRSVPCFEYWILLHFERTSKPHHAVGHTSACASVTKELKKHLPDYRKGSSNIFRSIMNYTDDAITNANITRKCAEASSTDNPLTDVQDLVEYLRKT